jgi:queuine tRNA-ribosyltransferase
MNEAQSLYVEQSRLSDRLAESSADPVAIWDVGLGAATNAMAAIQVAERHGALALAEGRPTRPLKIISFENDLDSLRLAFANSDKFTYLRHGAPAGILKEGRWRHRELPIEWELFEGDFFAVMSDADRFNCSYSSHNCQFAQIFEVAGSSIYVYT